MKKKHLILTGLLLTFCFFQTQAQVRLQVYVDKAGTLTDRIKEKDVNTVTHLVITGKINAIDFKSLRDGFKSLESLDLTNADIRAYAGKHGTYPGEQFYMYPPNCIPAYAFCYSKKGDGKSSLKEVYLSEKIKNIEDAAFKGCNHLYICDINRRNPSNLFSEGLADTLTAVFIPAGSKDAYRYKKNWEKFVLIEHKPVSMSIRVEATGTLQEEIQKAGGIHPKDINFLTIEGKLDNDDLKLISDYMINLVSIDIEHTNVTHLPDFTFAQKKNLLRIKLPQDLQTIGQRVFSGCERLNGTIVLPMSVSTIEYGAFLGCTNLQQVIVSGNNLISLGKQIFGEERSKLVYSVP